MCNRHRRSRGFTIFIWLYDLEKWHKVTGHKDGVNAAVDIGGQPLLWCKHLVSICYRRGVIADSNLDSRLLLADDVRQAAEAAVAARSRSQAWPLDVVFKPKPREVSACYIERAQHCYGRPNYAMTTSYQWTAFNVYLMQNWNPDISGLERARLIL